ncbi:MAG: leucine-rich repeat protein, partial [Clostridia bacterium]|nr:leucine-rich repeat protein [Clostridia bacterium]
GDYVGAFGDANLTKYGHTFDAWYYGEGVGNGNAKRYVDEYFNEVQDITLYANYTPNTYTVTFDYQGGIVGKTTETVVFGKDFTFPVPTHSDATKTFAGWSTAPNGGGTGLTDDKGQNTVGWPVGENTTVYVYWHANVFKFTKTKLAGSNADVYSVAAGARINSETEITIPQNYNGLPVKIVEANAFRDCSKLATINIPNTVELIFDGRVSAFTGCTALQNINIIKVEGNKLIRYWSKDGVVFDYGLIDEQNGESAVAFFPMGKTGSYTIPEGVHKVPNEVFKDVMLTSITIASTVKYIGTDAFYSCDDLTEIKFAPTPAGSSASPLEIDSQAFRSCTKLESITFPARLSEIKLTKYELSEYTDSEPPYQNISTSYTSSGVENPFISCSLFKEINVEDGGQYYSSQDGVLFNANKTELLYVPQYKRGAYTIPNGVKKIADGAFAICYYLTGTLTIPNTVETIGECAFYNAYGFKDLVFKGQRFNALTIGKYAFRSASGFTSVVFEATSNVKEIGEGAFYSSGYIKTIEIPASVETIGDQAFRGCWSLGTVTFEASANAADLTFGDAVFYGTRITEFNVPAHAVDLGGVLSGMDKLRKVNVDPNNENYASDADGILFDKDKKTLLYYPKTKTGNYVVPDTVEVIGAGVFTNNSNIVEVTIGKNVKEIGDSAFAYCTRLTTVNFEDNTEAGASLELGARVFYECRAITSIELPVQTKSYGGYCFAYMDSMSVLDLNEGLTEMGAYGIYYCPLLTTIEIPSTVTATSYYGIAYNYGLTSITFAKNTQGDTAVTEFGSYSFYYNREVTAFEIPKSVKTIGYYGMYMGGSSSKLASVTFEAGSQLEKI